MSNVLNFWGNLFSPNIAIIIYCLLELFLNHSQGLKYCIQSMHSLLVNRSINLFWCTHRAEPMYRLNWCTWIQIGWVEFNLILNSTQLLYVQVNRSSLYTDSGYTPSQMPFGTLLMCSSKCLFTKNLQLHISNCMEQTCSKSTGTFTWTKLLTLHLQYRTLFHLNSPTLRVHLS